MLVPGGLPQGAYQYRHPLTEAMAHQAELAAIQAQTKAMTKKDGGTVTADCHMPQR